MTEPVKDEIDAMAGGPEGAQSVAIPADVEAEAERLWDAAFHPAMADDREWSQVDGLMRLAYLGRAAHGLLIGREVAP